jgi:hypothetical protein
MTATIHQKNMRWSVYTSFYSLLNFNQNLGHIRRKKRDWFINLFHFFTQGGIIIIALIRISFFFFTLKNETNKVSRPAEADIIRYWISTQNPFFFTFIFLSDFDRIKNKETPWWLGLLRLRNDFLFLLIAFPLNCADIRTRHTKHNQKKWTHYYFILYIV